MKEAAKIGYRHIDTAQAYQNERGVGEGIRASGVKREEMFVTTKLAAEVKSYEEAVASIDHSLKTLGLDYIDMMIIHSPKPWTGFHKVEVETHMNQDTSNMIETNRMNIQIGDRILTATLVQNSSAEALKEALADGPITVNMRDYESMEKVGSLGMNLPRNDEQITTEAGDIILFQGSAFVIYYAPNSWNFTRLGKITSVTTQELKEILGDGNVTITLSLQQE